MIVGVMGESGAGKSSSLKTLDPATTCIVDSDKKGLPWKGWREQYVKNANYFVTDEPSTALRILKGINTQENYKHIRVVVFDTINGIMVADEMRRSKEKGYDKWMDMAASIYELVDYALTVRDDLTVIFMAHTQTDHDDNGFMWTRIKTSGRKLDKITLESKFNVVLLAKLVDGKHVFETVSNYSTAKCPADLDALVDNDMAMILDALEGF